MKTALLMLIFHFPFEGVDITPDYSDHEREDAVVGCRVDAEVAAQTARNLAFWSGAEETAEAMSNSPSFAAEMEADHSRAFLRDLWGRRQSNGTLALDLCCKAAGVGRVSFSVLLHFAEAVEAVELVPRLGAAARVRLGQRLRALHLCAIQAFYPAKAAYDLIWVQWSLELLTDREAISLLGRLRLALRPGGMLVVKESVEVWDDEGAGATVDGHGGQYFAQDHKYVRTMSHLRRILSTLSMRLVSEELFWWPDEFIDPKFESNPLITFAYVHFD